MLVLSAPPVQGATSPVAQLFNTDFEGLPEDHVAVEGGGPRAALHEDFLVADEDASKGGAGSAARKFIPSKPLAMLVATRRTRELPKEVTSTYMQNVEITPVRHNKGEMGRITVLLIKDSVEAEGSMAPSSLSGFTLGGNVDPLGPRFSIFPLGHTETCQSLQTTASFPPSGRDLSALLGSE